MSSKLNPAKNFFILLLGAGLIGLAPLFVRWSELSPSWILFYRMFLALPFLALINIYFNKDQAFRLKDRKSLLFAAIAALAFATDMSAWHWSIQFTSIANSTIIVNTAPIYVVILGIFLFKESVSGRFLLSFVSTYIGVFGLVYFSNTKADGALFGDALALMAAFMYATYLLIISKLGRESSINIIFYTTFFTCLFSLIPAFIESRDFLPTSKFEIYNLFAMAILCQVGGQFFITYSMPRLTASYGSVGLLMQPIIATIFGALIFSEYLNLIQLGFVILALVGIYFARLEINPPNKEGHDELSNQSTRA
ncbi:DMT family transporter [Gammaproteobacteria bacterium]|nr:DMT family transporter [Gammaproteobacteria bacterium]